MFLGGTAIPYHPDEVLDQHNDKLNSVRRWVEMAYTARQKTIPYGLKTCMSANVSTYVSEQLRLGGIAEYLSADHCQPFHKWADKVVCTAQRTSHRATRQPLKLQS